MYKHCSTFHLGFSDTNYIRLAKMGGREDLLRHREPKAKSNEAKGYPRNEWFYLEDNMMEENNAAQPKYVRYIVYNHYKGGC